MYLFEMNLRTVLKLTCAITLGLVAGRPSQSQDVVWPTKTGPAFNGQVGDERESAVPRVWDLTSSGSVAWSTPLGRTGHSTPVVGGGKVWLTSATEDGREQFISAFDTQTGETLVDRLLFENPSPEPLGNPVNNYAAPTSYLESDAVYAHFGTYGTARLDPSDGDVVWQRRDIHARHFRGPGSSPIVVDDLLILTLDGIDQQFVIALDKKTGDTVWRTDRSTDYGDLDDNGKPLRDGDLRKAYGTPAIMTVGDQTQIVSVGSRAAFGYDVTSGKEVWTLRHSSYNAAAQPLVVGDLVIINTGSRAELIAVRVDQSTVGDITDSHVAWIHPRGNSNLSYPVLCNGLVAWVTDKGVASAVDAKTGESVWNKRIGGNFVASPLVVGDLLYVFSSDGKCSVGRASRESLQILETNAIPEDVTASAAAMKDGLIIRSKSQLLKLVKSSTSVAE